MDRIAIVSDIHANITAWEKFLEDSKKRKVNKIICLGDIVYKGCSPVEVIDSVRKNCDVIIQGNCDEYFSSDFAKEKKFWTSEKIGEERANFLRNLPKYSEFYLSGYLVRLFHASPYGLSNMYNPVFSNDDSTYSAYKIENPEDLFLNTEWLGKKETDKIPDIVCYGHLHTPNIFRIGNKMVINPGTIGMPSEMKNSKEITPDSKFTCLISYMIIEGYYQKKDIDEINIQLIRLPYNVSEEIDRLNKSDMPTKDTIIRKLQTGEP